MLSASATMKLKRLRGNRSQHKVATDIGISTSSYAMYETGSRVPRDEVKRKIADYYNRTVQYIFFTDEVTNSEKGEK